MTRGSDRDTLLPNDAFAALGNENRMEILQVLAEADEPLSFSQLRDRVGITDSGQFNYHLDTIEGHFLHKVDGKYQLRQSGRRVVAAVLSGAITDDPVIEPTAIDQSCPLCGGSTLVAFIEGRAEHYCRDCAGYYGRTVPSSDPDSSTAYGYLGSFQLPPAGTEGRSPDELFRAATTWGLLNLMAVSAGVCPECAATVTKSPHVCTDHDRTDGTCDQCGNLHAILVSFDCTNCLYGGTAVFTIVLLANVDVVAFLATNGINPVAPSDKTAYSGALMEYDEELLSTDPFEARFTLEVEPNETLTLTVDEDLAVVGTERS